MSGKTKFERKLSCKRRESSDEDIYDIATQPVNLTASTSTPVRTANLSEDEDSPCFPCSTQELQDEVDVLWKWNSPQMKQFKSKRPKKRLLLQSSPKVPLRRHPSAEAQSKKDFDKLREELRALREELNKPDDEDSLMLSPREELEIKKEVQLLEISAIDELMLKNLQEPFDIDSEEDVFNDDMDDIMLQCTQQIEEVLNQAQNQGGDFKHLVLNAIPCATDSTSSLKGSSNFDGQAVPSSSRHQFGTIISNTNEKSSNISSKSSVQTQKTILNHINLTKNSETDHKICSVVGEVVTTKPKYNFKKNTSPKYSKTRDPTPSHQMVDFNKMFGHLENSKVSDSGNLEMKKQTLNQPKTAPRATMQSDSAIFDDSFDMILSQIGDAEIEQLTQVVDLKIHNQTLNSSPTKNSVKSVLGSLTDNRLQINNVTSDSDTRQVDRTLTNTKNLQSHVDSSLTNTKNVNNVNKQLKIVNISGTGGVPFKYSGVQSRTVQSSGSAVQTDKKSNVFPRFNSAEGRYGGGTKVQTATGKVEFHRTQSFEISNGSFSKNKPRSNADTFQNRTNQQQSEITDSPIKCSPDEIEKKRLAALAIREAKRQKEIIEKNRQEALKRLEERRKKNVDMVKSSLVKRL